MTKPRSLRSHVISGSLLWTLGLAALVAIVATEFIHHHLSVILFLHDGTLLVIALGSMVAGFTELRRGLQPFNALRTSLAEVRAGRAHRVEGDYPAEVQPLVTDLNALIDHRDEAVTRARAKAGDLAHGLKTPLTVLAHEAERARAGGLEDVAEGIDRQVERMRRHVDYHLAHARAAASARTLGAACAVLESAEAIVRTLRRLTRERALSIDVRVPADHRVQVQREDLDEMLGNLLDNACTWATSRVVIESHRVPESSTIAIVIDDDGPGLAPDLREAVLQRGVRADQTASGSGLGLAIVVDLASVYGGSLVLSASPLGGLRVRLVI